MAEPRLRISEIFHSIQGESSRAGLPTVFVRLTGCPLRCVWCDTEYAFNGGEMLPLSEVMAKISAYDCKTICVTGGEPLAQKSCIDLLHALCESGYSVSLETSGALDIGEVDSRVSRIMDLKAPDSGEESKNRWENLRLLTPCDEVKFVLASETDYAWAVDVLNREHLAERCAVLFSPVQGALSPATLAEWVVRDRLPVRFQLQLHKILWGSERAR
ncbi:MAG TPA: 7-carboxy-7-deazaguanine synthase QueE [Rhodocyclaceae bacterium]|jgi:7-carboxy-7-deazaguanine synthase|nr:7-carboxy-7-deazaguanine synthase QueE [Rhodocyclaceae bacterium]